MPILPGKQGNADMPLNNNIGISCFYKGYLGWEAAWDGVHMTKDKLKIPTPEQELVQDESNKLATIYPVEINIPTVQGDVIKVGVGDRSHNGYVFHGRLKTIDAEVKIKFPASEDNLWIRRKAYQEWDSRSDQRRWHLMVFQYDEAINQKIRGWRFMSGMVTNLFDAQSLKWDSGEAGMEEYSFIFERAMDLNVADELAANKWQDITNRLGLVPRNQAYNAPDLIPAGGVFDPWAWANQGNPTKQG